METRIYSAKNEVIIGDGRPVVLIGERINPAGKKKMSESLRSGNLEIIRQEALAQVEAEADVIDINVGTFGVDEATLLPQAVQTVISAVDVPVCIDSDRPEALEAALKLCTGKPLINSVTGEEAVMEKILPLVKLYGAAVIGLTQDRRGIPTDSSKRVSIAHKIVKHAEAMGIAREDIIIDCLASAIGADASSGIVTIETIRRIKDELGVNMVLGASNISFGLPDRYLVNNAFVAIAIAAGVTCLIVDAAKIRRTVLAADLVLNHDKYARRYVEAYRSALE